MIPISGSVLLVAAVLCSPALYSTLVTGSMPLEIGLTRYLLVTGVCWVALSVAASVVWPTRVPVLVEERDGEEPPAQ